MCTYTEFKKCRRTNLNGKIGRNKTGFPYFIIAANMSRSEIDIPVQAFMQFDGFEKPGLVLYYSVHAGKDVLKKALIAHGLIDEYEMMMMKGR